jgi:hypothetical protein
MPGPQGPPGPSEGYTDHRAGFNQITNESEIVASVSLPAGRFILSAKAMVGNQAAVPSQSECVLRTSVGGVIDQSYAILFPVNGAPGSWDTMPLAGALASSIPVTIEVACRSEAGNGFVQYVWLIATRVGTLQ